MYIFDVSAECFASVYIKAFWKEIPSLIYELINHRLLLQINPSVRRLSAGGAPHATGRLPGGWPTSSLLWAEPLLRAAGATLTPLPRVPGVWKKALEAERAASFGV